MGTDSGVLERDKVLAAAAAITTVKGLNAVGKAFKVSCASGTSRDTIKNGVDTVPAAPNSSPDKPSTKTYIPPKRQTFNQYEQEAFNRCANLRLDCGFVSDVAEKILEPVFEDPLVIEDPVTLGFIKYNRAAQQALVTASICMAAKDSKGFLSFMDLLKKITKADKADETTVGRLIQSGARNIKAKFLPVAGDASPSADR